MSSQFNKILTTINSVTSNYSFTPDLDNVIVIDTSNNRIGINTTDPECSLDISGGKIKTKHLEICGGYISSDLIPDGSFTLGTSEKPWSQVFISGGTFQSSDVNRLNILDTLFLQDISVLSLNENNILFGNPDLYYGTNNIFYNNCLFGQDVSFNSNVEITNNLLLNGELHGPSTIIIDPEAIGNNSGTVQIKGDLEVLGNQTTIKSTILDICDNRIKLNGANQLDAGIDISINDNTKSFIYSSDGNKWTLNDASLNVDGNLISESEFSSIDNQKTIYEIKSTFTPTDTVQYIRHKLSSIDYPGGGGVDMNYQIIREGNTNDFDTYGISGFNRIILDTMQKEREVNDPNRVRGLQVNSYARFNEIVDFDKEISCNTIASSGNITANTAKIGNFNSNDAVFSHKDYATTDSYALRQNENGATILNSSTGQPIIFRINNNTKIRLDSNGYVGIGTTSPSSLLDVNGNITSDTTIIGSLPTTYSNNGVFAYKNKFNATDYSLRQNSSGYTVLNSASNQNMDFRIGDNRKMILTSDGSFGIGAFTGINSPSASLHIEGNNRAIIGNAITGYWGTFLGSTFAYWGHSNFIDNRENNYSLLANSLGTTFINCSTGQSINFRINNNINKVIIDETTNSFYGATNTQNTISQYLPSNLSEVLRLYDDKDVNERNFWAFHIQTSDDGDNFRGAGGTVNGDLIICQNNTTVNAGTSSNPIHRFLVGGFIASDTHTSTSNAEMNFTGQHRCIIDKYLDISNVIGLIVYSSGKYINIDNSLNPSINESLPLCNLTNIENDKRIFGVISNKEDNSSTRNYLNGRFGSFFQKTNINEARFFINSVGEGGIWVCNKNGSLENGDYISSSNILGYGQKQILHEDFLTKFTVAKITCDCSFNLNKVVKQKLKTYYDTSNNQYIDYSNNQIQYINDLDSSNNIIYDYIYNTRFVDLSGNLLIDENDYNLRIANGENVYIACFVGCTYHCG